MENKIKLEVKNISKKFSIGHKKDFSLLAIILSLSGKEKRKELQVLDNVSFSVNKGEIIGIIGKNGSGKSTLLGVIAGIYKSDNGEVAASGKITYLSGWGLGLQSRLTMRDNIYLMGSFMGLGKKDVTRKFNEIVLFSGLNEFVDTKIYQFSSGMVTRLAFSITTNCLQHNRPDILLLDEVFGSGGDIDFQNKALQKMEELIGGGTTVIMVSHSLDLVEKYCNRVIWLDKGKIVEVGEPNKIINDYINSSETKKKNER